MYAKLLLIFIIIAVASKLGYCQLPACFSVDHCELCSTPNKCDRCVNGYGLDGSSDGCTSCRTECHCLYCTNADLCDTCDTPGYVPDDTGSGCCRSNSSCPRRKFGISCEQTCHCRNDISCYRNGTCPSWVGCADGWEGESCSQDINECSVSGYCSQNCTNTPGNYSCSCISTGYRLDTSDNSTCLDIDECSTSNGGCSHYCNNFEGSYSCSCPTNFTLSDDSHTCTGVATHESTSRSGWRAATIALACILSAVLVSLPFCACALAQYYRKKYNKGPMEERSYYVTSKTLQSDSEKPSNGRINFARDVTPENQNKPAAEVASSRGRSNMADAGFTGDISVEYQDVELRSDFGQKADYEPIDANDRKKEIEKQQKQTYSSLIDEASPN